MVALAPDEDEARKLLVRDVEHHSLRVTDIQNKQEVVDEAEIAELDDHLEANFRDIGPGSRTVWGTIHCYKGEGTA